MTAGITERVKLKERSCVCFAPCGEIKHIAVLCGWNMAELLPKLSEELPETLLFSAEADSGRDFTPWAAAAVWEGEPFSGEGQAYLGFLLEDALPHLFEKYGYFDVKDRLITGYSLGGLFSLWASAESGAFGQAASLSGSTWYPDFTAYFATHLPDETKRFYLSLGDREPYGGPPVLRAVGVCTEKIYAILLEKQRDVVFEWNRGGHGKGIENRWRKALRWAANGWKGNKV